MHSDKAFEGVSTKIFCIVGLFLQIRSGVPFIVFLPPAGAAVLDVVLSIWQVEESR